MQERAAFLPLEDCRDAYSPIRVLHDAVTLAGIADMGPMLPMLSNLPEAQRGTGARRRRSRCASTTSSSPPRERASVARRPRSCAAIAGTAWTTSGRSATARAPRRWATPSADYRGKPVIAIVNTWSDINPCHTHFKQRVEEVKRGIWQAGGFPVEIPAMTLSEPFQKPTTMLYRNLLAMETEEILRSYPADGCVLMGGCDKTTPALLMGAISMDLPTIYLPAGPMLRGDWNGVVLGSGSDTWKYWAELRCGNITQEEWTGIENGIARSPGHCMTMGTASTMTSAAEVLGLMLPGFSSIPAADSRHAQMATLTGRRIVDMVWEDLKPSDILTDASFDNAVTTVLALSGSSNSVVHLIAMARRAGFSLDLARFDAIARRTPVLAEHPPRGEVPHGGLLLRRRAARAARRAG